MSNNSTNQVAKYQFENDWFSHNAEALFLLIRDLKPSRILEIGSFEGLSTVNFILESLKYTDSIEIQCIDSWEGGQEHKELQMSSVEARFLSNVELAKQSVPANKKVNVTRLKGYSHKKMIELLSQGYDNYFDFIYVDGSHEAPDVLLDALLAHKLVRVGGVIAFDDYLWSPGQAEPMKGYYYLPSTDSCQKSSVDHYLLPKPAVDAYTNIFREKARVLWKLPSYQLYVQKISD